MNDVTSVKNIMDEDETVAMFEVNKVAENQSHPWWFDLEYSSDL